MSLLPAPLEPVRPGLLTRATPVTRILVGALWITVALLSARVPAPLVLAVAATAALVVVSGLPLGRVPRRLAPLGLAALGLGLITIAVHPANADAGQAALATVGPLRVTAPAVLAGLAIALRLTVIALVSVMVFSTSDPTRVADSLVQQWHAPYRFAYGTLGALRIVPLLAADWTAITAARRIRGIEARSPWGRARSLGGLLLVMLVSAVRRAERMALAMDARGFDSGIPRTTYRPISLGMPDLAVLAGGIAVAAGVLIAVPV